LTDAIEPKLAWVAAAPWDDGRRFRTAADAYRHYAELNFGPTAAPDIARILNGNEPRASTFGECEGTPSFFPEAPRPTGLLWFKRTAADERRLALRQLTMLDRLIAEAPSLAIRQRLDWLRCRIAAAGGHLELNDDFQNYQWRDLPGAIEPWVHNFTHRVNDISSLGNVVSSQNRYLQTQYLPRESRLSARQPIQPPALLSVRGTPQGALLEWQNKHSSGVGFNVYRDGVRLNEAALPSDTGQFEDHANGRFRYAVSVIDDAGNESAPSVPAVCEAGGADRSAPRNLILYTPTTL
jgi:hypothetical protein